MADAAELAVPTLLLVAESDELVDPAGSRAFATAAAPSGQLTTRFFASLYPDLFNEADRGRSHVIMPLRDWLGRQLPRGKHQTAESVPSAHHACKTYFVPPSGSDHQVTTYVGAHNL